MRQAIFTTLLAAALALAGCATIGCKRHNDGPVHPTDEQINNAAPGEQTQDPPYTPWWAEAKK